MMNFTFICRVVRLTAFWRGADEHSVMCDFLAESEMYAFVNGCSIFTAHAIVCDAWSEYIKTKEAA